MKIFNPSILWLLLLIVPAMLVSYFQFYRVWHNFTSIGGSPNKKDLFKRRFVLEHSCLYLFFIFAVLAYSDIYYGTHPVRYENSGLDIVFVMDVSNSMLATDSPPSRLEQAKSFAQETIYTLPGSRMGGVAFKGLAVPAIPLTTDSSSLMAFLRSAHPSQLTAPGSNLASGINAAESLFDHDPSRKKVILLFSDGETLSGNLHHAIQKAKDRNITIFSIGFGTDGGSILFNTSGNPILDKAGNQVHSRLEESALIEAARLTNGRYFKAGSSAFNDLLSEFKTHQSNEYRIEMEDRSLFPALVFLMLITLSARMAVRSAKWQELYGSY